MGNDGGTIMGRMFIKAPLQPPVVSDHLGYLINKEALLALLISKKLHPRFAHITSLRDVKPLQLSLAAAGRGGALRAVSSSSTSNAVRAVFECPVTGLAATGRHRFLALRPCGHVVSERAVKELKATRCPVCSAALEAGRQWSVLNPSGDLMLQKLKELKELKEMKEMKELKEVEEMNAMGVNRSGKKSSDGRIKKREKKMRKKKRRRQREIERKLKELERKAAVDREVSGQIFCDGRDSRVGPGGYNRLTR